MSEDGLDSITDTMGVNLSKMKDGEGHGSLACYKYMGSERVGHDLVTEHQQQ